LRYHDPAELYLRKLDEEDSGDAMTVAAPAQPRRRAELVLVVLGAVAALLVAGIVYVLVELTPRVARRHRMGMARIAGNAKPGLYARFCFWWAQRLYGKTPTPMGITAHNPWIFRAATLYEACLPKAKLVDARGKELASILAAMRVGCPF
jgi:hypothetical protein